MNAWQKLEELWWFREATEEDIAIELEILDRLAFRRAAETGEADEAWYAAQTVKLRELSEILNRPDWEP